MESILAFAPKRPGPTSRETRDQPGPTGGERIVYPYLLVFCLHARSVFRETFLPAQAYLLVVSPDVV